MTDQLQVRQPINGLNDDGKRPPCPKLDAHYVKEGWSVQFSTKQQKYYFFHADTGTSCWSWDDLTKRQADVEHDRTLRIVRQNSNDVGPGASPPAYPTGSRSERVESMNDGRQRKRRASADEGSSNKAPRMSIEPGDEEVRWCFEVDSGCFVEQRHDQYLYFGTHPEMERFRSLFFFDLRKMLQQRILHEFGIDLQQSSFIRWITEVNASDAGFDPIFPTSIKKLSQNNSLRREILYEVPIRLLRPSSVAEANRMVGEFSRHADRCLRKWCPEDKAATLIQEMAGILQPVFNKEKKPGLTGLMDVLHQLVTRIKPSIDAEASRILESICESVLERSQMRAAWLRRDFLAKVSNRDFAQRLSAAVEAGLPNPPALDALQVLIMPDVPARILGVESDFAEAHRPSRAVLLPRGGTMMVRTQDSGHELRTIYFEKLRALYQANTPEDRTLAHFPTRLWMLLERYSTYLGLNFDDVNQAALPPAVFDCLNKEFGVTFELFASPFNCYFKQFCSAFPDTDCFFGSRGPLQNFNIAQGSFQANPPFTEELLSGVVDFITKRLEESDGALSVAFFVPDWRDPPVEALQKLENSPFNRAQLTFPARRHGYRQDRPLSDAAGRRNGHPHGLLPSCRGTTLIFIQNDEGYERWTPTAARQKKIRESFYSNF